METPNYDMLPAELRDGMERYLLDGIRPGSFLTTCLENNFIEAACHADQENRYLLREIAQFIYNGVP